MRHRIPDDLPPDYPDDSDRIVYIERPVKPDHAGHIMQALTIAILIGIAGFLWNFTVTTESRLTKMETRMDVFDERYRFPKGP